jgi:hypothetical protein
MIAASVLSSALAGMHESMDDPRQMDIHMTQ